MNVKGALLHVIGDALGSVAAIVAGALVTFFGIRQADPIASLFVAALLGWGVWRLVAETTHVLMEGVPDGLDVHTIEHAIAHVAGVEGIRDLHVWGLAPGFPMITVHVAVRDPAEGVAIAAEVARMLAARFHVRHATVQPEVIAA